MQKKYYIGLDVGGTKVEGAVAELNIKEHSIKVFSKKRIATNSKSSAPEFVKVISALINDLILEAKINSKEIKAIGIGLPGSLDPISKIMLNGNTQFLIGFDLISALKNELEIKVPIFAQNDANLFVLAEAWGGAGIKYFKEKNVPFLDQVAVGITLGTGVGGGLIALGKIFNGAHGSALEVGHIVLKPGGLECYCGQKGCAERYLSGTALNKLLDSKEIFKKAAEGDSHALLILSDYRQHFIHFLSILNNLFNPHYIVFGGGLSAQEILFKDLKRDLEENIFLSKEFCPEIYINQLGDSSGLFGAMIYAQELLDS